MTPRALHLNLAPLRSALLAATTLLGLWLFAATLPAIAAAQETDTPTPGESTDSRKPPSTRARISLGLEISEGNSEDRVEKEQVIIDVRGVHGGGAFGAFHPITVGPDDVMRDDLVSIGGPVVIHGEVRGDTDVLFGTLEITGRVEGDTVALLTDTVLSDTAVIDGDFVHLGGSYDVSPNATVHGERVHIEIGDINLGTWDLGEFDVGEEAQSALQSLVRCFYLLKMLMLGLLFWVMFILVALVPRRITGTGEVLGEIWGRTIFMGLLAYAAYAVLLGIFICLIMVIVGVPLVAILVMAWFGVKAFGLASILWLLGDRIAHNALHREVKPLIAFLIGFLIYLPTQIVPPHLGVAWFSFSLLGSLLGTSLTVLAVGLCLVSQFGSVTVFAPRRPATAAPAAPPAGPPPAAPPEPPASTPPTGSSGSN